MRFWKSTLNRVNRLRQLPRSDLRVLLCALVLVPLTSGMLEILGFRRVYAVLERLLRSRRPSMIRDAESHHLRARTMRHLVQRAAAHSPVTACCLPVSIVVWAMLRFEGLPAVLHLGVRSSNQGFKAHAWVESGSVVLDDEPGIWRSFPPLPGTLNTEPRL